MEYWIQITSGRGPEECCWVVSRLVRYLLDTENRSNIALTLLDATPGRLPDTFHSALLRVEGDAGVTEFISHWEGTIQWSGQSIFRPNHKRKNWFVGITALKPVTTGTFQDQDIRIDRMRSSGPGGQHVNTTESGIRITHLPTGLSAIAQEERSQHRNRKLALARLEELLNSKERQKQTEFDRNRWNQHNLVERGNAVQVFTGKDFILK